MNEAQEELKEKRPAKKMEKTKEVFTYLFAGFWGSLNVLGIIYLLTIREEYFNFSINFGRTIEIGFLLLKFILLIAVLVIDLKVLKNTAKQWSKYTEEEKEEKREGEKEFKRLGIIGRLFFYWRSYEARSWMDKYNEAFRKLQRRIGRIRGEETKELKKMKEEMIKGVLLWKEDFQITQLEKGKGGKKKITNIPVTKEFLEGLYMDEIYEDYLVRCIDITDKFINGKQPEEEEIEI